MRSKRIEEYLKNDSIIDTMFKERNKIVEDFVFGTKEKDDLIEIFGKMEDELSEYSEILDLLYDLDDAYSDESNVAKKAIYTAGIYDGISLKL